MAFDFDGYAANYYAQAYIEGRASEADVIRNLVIEGADEGEAKDFVESIRAESAS
ncbi:MAG: hypothetical protein H8E39_00225 [Alphaproteobacteria bacterium]|nr:hypothetical protein [Alphaproteobacteria bacterium]